jgi:hypothetical protein
MRAAEEAQRVVVQRLQPERDAIDSRRREIGEARRLDRGGIGLQRDLDRGRSPNAARPPRSPPPTVAGGISEGVPPPKKIEPRGRPGSRAASWARSASIAPRHASWSTLSRTWLLKSQ